MIYYHSADQQAQAMRHIAELNAAHSFPAPIVTEVTACQTFFPAEKYHQGYFRANGRAPYCQMVVSPKVAKFRSKFANKAKD